MFRSDRDALAQEVEQLRQERAQLQAQNDAMRTDLLARRQQPPPARGTVNVYKQGAGHLSSGERVALLQHEVGGFPVWAAVALHFVTFGLFSLVHFSRLHDQLPKAEHDDPGSGKAIGFSFIPYFNLYWVVFNTVRLADRINLQFRLRGLPDRMPRGLAIAAGALSVVPYVNIALGFPILWPIAVAYFQSAANALAALDGAGAGAAQAGAEAWTTPRTGDPRLRVPLVRDLPGPADVGDHPVGYPRAPVDDHEAEIEAEEALRRHGDRDAR